MASIVAAACGAARACNAPSATPPAARLAAAFRDAAGGLVWRLPSATPPGLTRAPPVLFLNERSFRNPRRTADGRRRWRGSPTARSARGSSRRRSRSSATVASAARPSSASPAGGHRPGFRLHLLQGQGRPDPCDPRRGVERVPRVARRAGRRRPGRSRGHSSACSTPASRSSRGGSRSCAPWYSSPTAAIALRGKVDELCRRVERIFAGARRAGMLRPVRDAAAWRAMLRVTVNGILFSAATTPPARVGVELRSLKSAILVVVLAPGSRRNHEAPFHRDRRRRRAGGPRRLVGLVPARRAARRGRDGRRSRLGPGRSARVDRPHAAVPGHPRTERDGHGALEGSGPGRAHPGVRRRLGPRGTPPGADRGRRRAPPGRRGIRCARGRAGAVREGASAGSAPRSSRAPRPPWRRRRRISQTPRRPAGVPTASTPKAR